MLILRDRYMPLSGHLPPGAPGCTAYEGGALLPQDLAGGRTHEGLGLPETAADARVVVRPFMTGLPMVTLEKKHKEKKQEYDFEMVPNASLGGMLMLRATPRGAK
jgi:hypothetical protein